VRSRKGRREIEGNPLQIWAHELIKCHVEVPSRMAWLKANPIASPSFSLVSCKQLAPPQNEFIYGPDHPGKKEEKKKPNISPPA